MRYYSYNEYDPGNPNADDNGNVVETVSEDEIRRTYYPGWCIRMVQKFGPGEYWFEDCLADWEVINRAWPVDE